MKSASCSPVEVDANDPAFLNPTKYIGPIYDEAQARALQAEKGWVFKADGNAFRRVVPSRSRNALWKTMPSAR